MSFETFIAKQQKKVSVLTEKLNAHLWMMMAHNNQLAATNLTKKSDKNRIQKELIHVEQKVIEIQDKIAILTNMDEIAKLYLASLPDNRKRINLDAIDSRFSLTTVPDLSRFPNLEELNISYNEKLVSGFDRLPITLRRLYSIKTVKNADASWIPRLKNLEVLCIRRNDSITEFPDLSGLTRLKEFYFDDIGALKQFPNLPLGIKVLWMPNTSVPTKYFTEKEYRRQQINYFTHKKCWEMVGDDAKQMIERINRINKFDVIREELAEKSAKMALNPLRIARLLEQSDLGLELDADWSDLYEGQERHKYSNSYC